MTENLQRAKYYRLTPAGKRQLASERSRWGKLASAIARILDPALGRAMASWLKLFRRSNPDRDLDDEIRFHLEQEARLRRIAAQLRWTRRATHDAILAMSS